MAKEEESKKVKRPTAKKRELQDEKKRLVNRQYKSQIRTAVRRFETNVAKKDSDAIQTSLNELYSILDKSVKKGVIKGNKASRSKARFSARAAAAKA